MTVPVEMIRNRPGMPLQEGQGAIPVVAVAVAPPRYIFLDKNGKVWTIIPPVSAEGPSK